MKRGIWIAFSAAILAALIWFFYFSPYWWYIGRHSPPWPSGELPSAMYDAVTLTPATAAGEDVCGANFTYAFAGAIVGGGGLYIHIVVESACDSELLTDDVAYQLSTVLNTATDQWLSITGPDGHSVRLGYRESPRPVGPGTPDHISFGFGDSFDLEPRDGRCRAVAVVWGKAPPGLDPGLYTIRTLDASSQVGLVPNQTHAVKLVHMP
ncbi:MAG: hypothetical protein R3B57_13320 [Phycisphaerales bacterium]